MSEEKDAIALVEQLTRKVIAGEIKPSHYSKVLCSLPNHLRHSVEVALAAVRCFLPALFYFPPDIRNNTEVIAAALSTDPDRVKEQFALYHLYLDSPGHFYHEFPVAQYIFIPMILLDDSIRNDIFFSNMACDFLLAYLSHALEVGEFDTQMNDLLEIDDSKLTINEFKLKLNEVQEASSDFSEDDDSELLVLYKVIRMMRYSSPLIRGDEECIKLASKFIGVASLAYSTNNLFNNTPLLHYLNDNCSDDYFSGRVFFLSSYKNPEKLLSFEEYIKNRIVIPPVVAYKDYDENKILKLCLLNPLLIRVLPYPASQKKEWLFSVIQSRVEDLKDITAPQKRDDFIRETIFIIPSCFNGINNRLCDSAIFLYLAQQSAEISLFAYPRCDQLLLSSAHLACLFVKYQGYEAYKLLSNKHQSSADVLELFRKNTSESIDAMDLPAPSREKIENIKLFYENTFCLDFFEQILSLPPFIGMRILNEFLTFTDRLRLSMVKKVEVEMPIENMLTSHFSIQ